MDVEPGSPPEEPAVGASRVAFALQHPGLIASLVVPTLVLVRLFVVSRGSVDTATGILSYANTADILIGSLIPLAPVIYLFAGYAALIGSMEVEPGGEGVPWGVVGMVVAIAMALGGVFLLPWTMGTGFLTYTCLMVFVLFRGRRKHIIKVDGVFDKVILRFARQEGLTRRLIVLRSQVRARSVRLDQVLEELAQNKREADDAGELDQAEFDRLRQEFDEISEGITADGVEIGATNRAFERVLTIIATFAILGIAAIALSSASYWTPAEALTLSDDTVEVGYVLSEEPPDLVFLRESDRQLIRIDRQHVLARQYCSQASSFSPLIKLSRGPDYEKCSDLRREASPQPD